MDQYHHMNQLHLFNIFIINFSVIGKYMTILAWIFGFPHGQGYSPSRQEVQAVGHAAPTIRYRE